MIANDCSETDMKEEDNECGRSWNPTLVNITCFERICEMAGGIIPTQLSKVKVPMI